LAEAFPVGAIEFLRRNPIETGLFNDYRWGSYMIWELRHRHKVFIDARTDLYEFGGVMHDYARIINAENPLGLLAKYGVSACLIEPESPLARFLESQPQWVIAYKDESSILFRRQ
jgi:hypothetical protein